jgi:Zn-finger nucleic acid-binding protein
VSFAWQATEALCPGCVSPLFVAWHEDVALHGCASCGGAWLDNEGCRRLLGADLPEGVANTARTSLDTAKARDPAATAYRTPARPEGAPRKCPWCAAVLGRAVVGAITVDTCTAHGTFFDPHELFAHDQATVLEAAEDDAFVAELKSVLSADRKRNAWVCPPLG